MKKANIHHQRNNDLRKSLIFNDFYEILCYFRQPFFKFGNKTAQQITNLPIFLSFFVMFLGVLQISLDTHNSSIFKNYPLFINLTNKKISQKFETLYLQFDEIHKTVASPTGASPGEDQYLKTHLSGETSVPTIFHQIQNSKQKQKTINLYKTFEQIGPILLSEIKKGTEKQKIIHPPVRPRRGQDEAIIHLGVDIPYQSWSSNTKNFNVTEDKLLTNWRFKDSDLIIQNLKKADEIPDKTYNIIQEFIVQYNNYIKEIENKKYISLKTGSASGLPKRIQIHQNKIFIKLVRTLDGRAKAGALFQEPMGNNYLKIGFWRDKTQLCPPLNPIHPISKNNRFATIRSPSAGQHLRYKKGNPKIFKNFGDLPGEAPISQILKEAVFVGLPQISPAKESLGLGSGSRPWTTNPFEKRLPTANLSARPPRADLAPADIFYQIQEIEDQIPMKIQGSQGSEWYPFGFAEGEAESGPRFASFHELVGPAEGWTLFDPIRPLGLDDHLSLAPEGGSQVQEYEVLTYTQKVWDTLYEKLSNLQVQMPPFMDWSASRTQQTGPSAKRSLLNIRLKPNFGGRRQAQTEFPNLLKFFKKIRIFLKNSKKFEKCQLKELKYIGQFDIEMTERANNQNHQKRSYHFKIRSKDKTQKNKKNQINTRSFFENIWFLPKPGSYRGVRLWAWQNGGSFRVSSHNPVSPSGLKPRFQQTVPSLKKGNQKTIQTTFDNYLQKSSHLLQRQDENPYLYFDQVISPEDYLLEALFFFIKQNLIPAKETFQFGEAQLASHSGLFGEEDDRTTAGDLRRQLGHPASKRKKNLTGLGEAPVLSSSSITPSISKILNYLNKRKKQRDFFLKNSGQILQIKNLLDKKRKIQISVLYDSILNNYLLDPRILERQQNFVKKTSYGGPELKIFKWLKPSLINDHIKNWALAELKDNIFWANFQNLFWPKAQFVPQSASQTHSGASTQNHPILFPLYKFKEDLKFQWLWFQVQRSGQLSPPSFDEDQNGMDKRAAFGPGQPSVTSDLASQSDDNPNYWIHFIQSHNVVRSAEPKVGPCLCMGKYYFIRKLPQIPPKVDHPIMTIKKTNLFKKKSYLYRIINLPIITPLKKKKIKYGKDILSNLDPASSSLRRDQWGFAKSTSTKFDILNLQNQFIHFYDRFFSIGDIVPSGAPIAFKVLRHGQGSAKKTAGYHSNTGRALRIFQNKKFQTTDILKDLDKGLLRGPTTHPIQKSLGQKQPIYPNPKGPRQMSGYIFPDLKRKQLSNWLAAKDPKNIELEIPISNINMDDFRKQLTELPIQWLAQTGARRSSLPTPFQTFQHQQKISQKRFWDHPFFEFRENWNNYSWSILFFLSSGWLFINLFKNLYKKYAKELVESGIDFLKRAGILDDVQWIKEELGMAPIDKGYRGIRHPGIQRKKFKNIIGLEHKHIISQVSEMVWFLKTKKLMKSTAIDPFIQVILFLSRHYDLLITKTIQTRLMKNWLPQSPAPSYQLRVREISPSYVIIQENLRILFPESKTYQSFEISPQQKETLRPFRFRLEKIKIETPETPPKIKNDISLALKNRNPIKPKGFLLTGPPGTGKTLLVQAIAGETSVPVVTQSGGLLQNPRLRGKGARTLHKLFLRAREIAPCIIFIDEIDGIGTRRQFLPSYIDIYGRYDPIEWLEEGSFAPPKMDPTQLPLQRRAEFLDDHDPYWEEPEFTQMVQSARIPIDVLQDLQFSRGARSEQLIMLTQLLIELDGLHSLENILVIGATNRLEILDPALMRPGRFQRILRFHLPNYHTRINLLKLYTHASKIGIENISWDYFSKRTYGLSSADIASIVFASELTAIQQSKTHTFETLERGIDLITSFPSDPVMFRLKNIFIFLENSIHEFFSKNGFYSKIWVLGPAEGWTQTVTSAQIGSLVREADGPGQPSEVPSAGIRIQKTRPGGFISMARMQETSNIYRNCYYNIGKLVVLFCLQIMMPFSSAYIRLWIRPKNFRFFFFNKNYEFDEFDQKMFSRKEIEKRLFAFFGGKAAESLFIFLPLHPFSSETYFHFDPTFLSINNSLEQSNFGMDSEIQAAQSLLKLMVEKWYFYLERIATEKFHPILENANLWEYSEKEILLNKALVDEIIIDLDMRNRLSKNEQKYSYQTWWMKKVATQLNYRGNLTILHWSRIYLSDPEDSAQNIEWVAPDEYFHTILRTRPYCMAWTHFLENGRFAISNLLLLQSFNTVFKTLRSFSEFMDFLADYFLRYECIRENEFQTKIDQFFRHLLYE